MLTLFHAYEIDDSPVRIQFPRVHSWLASTYWSPDIPLDTVIRAATHSALVVGAYYNDTQVAYMRLISDRTRFAYLADVFVDPAHRRRGIAQAMVRFCLNHPDFKPVTQWLLITQNAHPVYQSVGFGPLPYPERFMTLRTTPTAQSPSVS